MKVKNKQILRKITWRSLKGSKFRNMIAIIAIMLTAVMFTTIATLGSAIVQSVQESTFRQVGTSAHGGFKYLTQEQYENISQSSLIKEYSYSRYFGFAKNPELAKQQHEIWFQQEKSAEWGYNIPYIGTLPKEYKDIVVPDTSLDLLGLPHELGQEITITIDVQNMSTGMTTATYTDTFTLCGITAGDEVMWASQLLVSEQYVLDNNPDNLINLDVFLSNSVDVEGKLDKIIVERGYQPDEIRVGINWGYMSSGEVDITSVVMIVLMMIIVMLSGYLIIYSVFSISVSGDIRFYGLLKTIGTTARQIKGIVNLQAMILSVVGIPLGLIFGFLLGTQLAPVMMGMTSFEINGTIKANPLIFLAAAAFSLLTVFISCRKPAKSAAKVSPIEALRYTESNQSKSKRTRKTTKVSVFSMAQKNVTRNRKKLVTVILSLSLSLVLLNSVVTIVDGFDMDMYLENQILSDFYFTHGSLYNHSISIDNKNFQGITDEITDKILSNEGVENSGKVYSNNIVYKLDGDDAIRTRAEEIMMPYIIKRFGNEAPSTLDHLIFQTYGLEKLGFDCISENYNDITWEQLNSGKYALVSPFIYDDPFDSSTAIYKIGEKIPLKGENGETVEYEIIGYIDYPYTLTRQYSLLTGFDVVICADEFRSLFPSMSALILILNVDDAHEAQMEEWAEKFTDSSELTYRSKAFYIGEFKSLQNTFIVLGGVLVFILALIGVLNFINVMATSIMTRRRELAMLQSVGMTGGQLKRMLISEGSCYALLTLLFALTIGSGLSTFITQTIAGQMWFFKSSFTVLPMLIGAPILLVLCGVVPIVCARILRRESVVERLRKE